MLRHSSDPKYSSYILSYVSNTNHYFALALKAMKVTCLIAAGLFLLLLSEAVAEETVQEEVEVGTRDLVDAALSDWDFSLGAGVGIGPDYEGSDDYDIGILPVLEASWRDDTFFISSEAGIGATLLRSEHFSAGVAFNYGGGREDGDNSALRGLGDIDNGVEVTAFAGLDFDQYAFGVDLTQDISGDAKGTLATFNADYRFSFLDERLMLEVGPDVSWASSDYMSTYFGVDGKQASRSIYNKYDADAGLKDVGLHLNAMYAFDENWAVMGGVGYSRLLGDAADSPIVDSENQFFSALSVSYSF
ncbi:MipA/OmpV family protein [Kiloniella sp.]|uniref:MipA/OmpV family protein n=1 Tax=Kiloniella sp. TaxID=1938587 RepID=UPI003B015274